MPAFVNGATMQYTCHFTVTEAAKCIEEPAIPMTTYPSAPSTRMLTPPHLLPPSLRHISTHHPPPQDSLDDVDHPTFSSPLLNGSIVHHSDRLTPLSDRLTPLSRRFRSDSRFTQAGARDALSYLRTFLDTHSSSGDVFGHVAQIEVALEQIDSR